MDEKLTVKINVNIKPASKIVSDEPKPLVKKRGFLQQHLAAVTVSLLPCIFGTAIGWHSPTTSLFGSLTIPVGAPPYPKQSAVFQYVLFAGSVMGTLVWSRVADGFGRKFAGYSIAAIYLVVWTIVEFTSNIYVLVFARFITGLCATGSLIICPLYISEVAEDRSRGTLASYTVLSMNIGIFLAYIFGSGFTYRILTAIQFIILVVFILMFTWLPETPLYLWKKGDRRAAENSLHWLRASNFTQVQEEIITLSTIEMLPENGYKKLLSSRGGRMGIILGLSLFAGQQLCGVLPLVLHTTKIFHESRNSINSEMFIIIIGALQLGGSLISTTMVERIGRKVLLLTSFLLMGLTLTILGSFFYVKEYSLEDTVTIEWLPLVLLCIYVVMYSLGIGPLPYVIVTETLSPTIRSFAFSLMIFFTTLLAFLSVLIFPPLVMSLGSYTIFWFIATFCYLSFVFTIFFLPETKSTPLADIIPEISAKPLPNSTNN